MPFGRYRGTPLEDLPDSYVDWLLAEANLRPRLRTELEDERSRRWEKKTTADQLASILSTCPSPHLVSEIVAAGYRSVSKRAHPDAGGSHDEMIKLTRTREWLDVFVRHVTTHNRR